MVTLETAVTAHLVLLQLTAEAVQAIGIMADNQTVAQAQQLDISVDLAEAGEILVLTVAVCVVVVAVELVDKDSQVAPEFVTTMTAKILTTVVVVAELEHQAAIRKMPISVQQQLAEQVPLVILWVKYITGEAVAQADHIFAMAAAETAE